MKLLSLFLASSSFAQEDGSDRGYLSFYDYGANSYDSSYYSDSYDLAKFTNQANDSGRTGNGLSCWTCHGRLSLASAESTSNNAWLDCATNVKSASVECKGDERSCLTEVRRRYDTVVEVKAMCKTPESCLYQWRRNQRYMPMFHLFGDQTESALPGFFDDECITSGTTGTKFNAGNGGRSQWESTCRHCCKAVAGSGCNHMTQTGSPIGNACGGSAGCAAANIGNANQFGSYGIANIQAYLEAFLEHNRAHPGEGRNSLPEDKFGVRTNAAGSPAALTHQSDKISLEDMDFHNNRHKDTRNNGAFGAVTSGRR